MENKIVKNNLGFDSNLYIKQDKNMFNYSIDTIMLGNFVHLNYESKHVLEIGTNNAALSIFIADRYSKLHIDAIEIQERACKLAQENVDLNNKQNQIKIIHEDFNQYWKKYIKTNRQKYQIIVCNPPYFPFNKSNTKKNVSEELLIATHEIKLNLDDLILGCSKIIEQKGYLNLVLPVERSIDCFEILRKYKFEPKRIQMIYSRIYDKPKFILIEARYQTGWGVHFLPNLYLYDSNNKQKHEYLPYIKKLYKPKKLIERSNNEQ